MKHLPLYHVQGMAAKQKAKSGVWVSEKNLFSFSRWERKISHVEWGEWNGEKNVKLKALQNEAYLWAFFPLTYVFLSLNISMKSVERARNRMQRPSLFIQSQWIRNSWNLNFLRFCLRSAKIRIHGVLPRPSFH